MELSEKIYRIRKARGYSQEQFGALLGNTSTGGISRQSVSAWEKGENEPTLDNLRDIAKVLNVSFDALLDEEVDLNDDATMMCILNGQAKSVRQSSTSSSFNYSIRQYGVKPIHYAIVAVYIAIVIAAIVTIILAFASGKTNNGYLFVSIALWAFAGATVSLFIVSVKSLVNGNPGIGFASLNENGFTIHTKDKASNMIRIPKEKVERLEIVGNPNRRYNNVNIIVKDREKPVTLLNVWHPKELLDIFGKLDSYIENSDGIKIL